MTDHVKALADALRDLTDRVYRGEKLESYDDIHVARARLAAYDESVTRPAEAATRENSDLVQRMSDMRVTAETMQHAMLGAFPESASGKAWKQVRDLLNKAIAALSAHQQQGADAWVETISVKEALKRADELRARALVRREKLLASGAHPDYAEGALSIPIIHLGNPSVFRAARAKP